ncbi:MAG: hypothetical protein HZA88_16030 [Verrucomicrobia bacterium]|nr:hypothetical protein [Verrucomicrobiota bacterium]
MAAATASARDALDVYPAPAGLSPSPEYRVEVSQNGRPRESFVYRTTAKWRSNKVKDTAWTTFAFDGRVSVRVTKLNGGFESCKILPSSRRIKTQVEGNAATFVLDQPARLSVEFDDSAKTHPLLIFADPPETNVPSRDATNVVWFAPGVHELPGGQMELLAGQTVYLAGGAFVRGRILGRNAKGARILGRGVLSGDGLPPTNAGGTRGEHFIMLRGDSDDVLVDGPTLVDSPHFNLTIAGQRAVVRNVKMISWWFSTDGVHLHAHGRVEDCFFKVNDDAVKLYHSDTTVRRCIIWQMENGAPFQISWNMPGRNAGFRVSDCDIIHVEHSWKNDNEAVFCAIHGGSGHMSDYVFENIRIENARWRLVSLMTQPNEFAKGVKEPGTISNVTFRNITTDGPFALPNRLRGFSANSRIEGITFDQVRVGGRLLTGLADNFDVDTNTVRNVKFLPKAEHR